MISRILIKNNIEKKKTVLLNKFSISVLHIIYNGNRT